MVSKLSLIDYKEWNFKVKNVEELNSANENDIIMKIDNLYCCCEIKNGSNNIMVFSEDNDIKNIKRMFIFIILLFMVYNINYITVSGSLRRYRFIEKMFENNTIKDPTIKDKRVLYIKLDKPLIDNLLERIR